ncbi:MAG: hypothetical protein P0Y66_11095 [Candidatus Kaistia colombiensis]|nr:MAG: hypothetical protein P0Y66_11095 [Kaistia sp.]
MLALFHSLRARVLKSLGRLPARLPEHVADLGDNTLRRERFLGNGKPMLVIFGPADLDYNRPIYRGLLAPIDCNYVIFQSRSMDFFFRDWSAILAHIRALSALWTPQRTVCWGFSMGGYASIRLGLDESQSIACAVAISPHFRLNAPVSRAQQEKQLPEDVDFPDLVDALNRHDGTTRFKIYIPTHSIRDSIHVLDAQEVHSPSVEIHYLNVDHGIEIKWKEDGSLRSAFDSLASDRPWNHAGRYTSSPRDISNAMTAVDYFRQSFGEDRPLSAMTDEDVMEAKWHSTKAIAHRAHKDWDGFFDSASRSLQLGAARNGFPTIYSSIFFDTGTPDRAAASILAWTLRYDIQATRDLLNSPRATEIVHSHMAFDDLCYLLMFAGEEQASCTAREILFRCDKEPSADLGVFAIGAAGLHMADAIERLAHRAAANNVHAAADAFFGKLASMRQPSTSDREAWQRTRAAIGLPPPSSIPK